MPRRPLLSASLIVLVSAIGVLVIGSRVDTIELIMLVMVVAATLATVVMRAAFLGRGLSLIAIGLLTILRTDYPPAERTMLDPISTTGRLEGVVITEQGTETGGWLAVAGELDLKVAPACSCTVIVRLPPSWSEPVEGCSIVVVGRVRLPDLSPGSIERGWTQSRAAPFMMTADSGGLKVTRPAVWHVRLRRVLRRNMTKLLQSVYSDRTARMMQAMLLGDRSSIKRSERQEFAISGTAHLFAVSGLHVGVIVVITIGLTGGAIRKWWQWVCIGAVVLCFVVTTGAEPPSIRAAIVTMLALLGRVTERHVDPLNLVGATVLIELLVWPTLLLRPSFLLSTIVTLSILWLVPQWQKTLVRCTVRPRSWTRALAATIGVHMSAAAGAAIPSAIFFEQVSILAPAVNFLVVPLLVLAMLVTPLVAVLWFLWPAGSVLLSWPVEMACTTSYELISASVPLAPNLLPAEAALVAVGIVGAQLWVLSSTSYRGLGTRMILSVLCIVLLVAIFPQSRPGVMVEARGNSLRVLARSDSTAREFWIGKRYGRPFVRSYHDRPP